MENVSLNNLMLRCFQWHQQAYVIGTSMSITARLWEPTLWGSAVASYLVLLPPSPVLDRAPNTHHLGSTTEGTASELRAPWGRRFLGPRKRCTSSHRSIWMKKKKGCPPSSSFTTYWEWAVLSQVTTRAKNKLSHKTFRRDSMVAFNIEKGPTQRLTTTGEGALLSCP